MHTLTRVYFVVFLSFWGFSFPLAYLLAQNIDNNGLVTFTWVVCVTWMVTCRVVAAYLNDELGAQVAPAFLELWWLRHLGAKPMSSKHKKEIIHIGCSKHDN